MSKIEHEKWCEYTTLMCTCGADILNEIPMKILTKAEMKEMDALSGIFRVAVALAACRDCNQVRSVQKSATGKQVSMNGNRRRCYE